MADELAPVEQDIRAYRSTFGSPAGGHVLIDLADFCRANEAPVHIDANGRVDTERSMILIGRLEVWHRIQQRLNLTPQQLALLYVRVPIIPGETDG
jgi:hypothetical protein